MTPIITSSDLQNALGLPTFTALFDDDNNGAADPTPVAAVIKRAHAKVISRLPDTFTGPLDPLPSPAPDLLFNVELEYAIAFSYERKPEYVRQYGTPHGVDLYARAERTMADVAASIERMPDFATKPSNVGGASYDTGNRILIDNADGTSNAGDF